MISIGEGCCFSNTTDAMARQRVGGLVDYEISRDVRLRR
jgi:hypothetical protein